MPPVSRSSQGGETAAKFKRPVIIRFFGISLAPQLLSLSQGPVCAFYGTDLVATAFMILCRLHAAVMEAATIFDGSFRGCSFLKYISAYWFWCLLTSDFQPEVQVLCDAVCRPPSHSLRTGPFHNLRRSTWHAVSGWARSAIKIYDQSFQMWPMSPSFLFSVAGASNHAGGWRLGSHWPWLHRTYKGTCADCLTAQRSCPIVSQQVYYSVDSSTPGGPDPLEKACGWGLTKASFTCWRPGLQSCWKLL